MHSLFHFFVLLQLILFPGLQFSLITKLFWHKHKTGYACPISLYICSDFFHRKSQVYGNAEQKPTWRKFISQLNSSCFKMMPSSLSCASSESATALTALVALSTVRWSPPKLILCRIFDSGSDGTYSAWQCWRIWSISSLLFSSFSSRPSWTWVKHMQQLA